MVSTSRVTGLAAILLSAPLLAACGADDAPDQSEWGTAVAPSAAPEARPSSTPSAVAVDGVDLAAGTIAPSALTAGQTALLEEMRRFEQVAEGEVGDGYGVTSGSFTDTDTGKDFTMARPDGLSVATRYAIGWGNGELSEYKLETTDGDLLRWVEGKILLDYVVEAPSNGDLSTDVTTVTTAIKDWTEEYGKRPSFSSTIGGLTLGFPMTDDSDAADTEVSLSDGISFGGYSASGETYEIVLNSETTKESAMLTHDGVTFSTPLELLT